MYTYIYGAAFLIGMVLTYYALKHYQSSRKIVSQGVRTEAEVVNFLSVLDENEMFKPVFEYMDLSGAKIQFNSEVAYSKPPMKIGDKIQVIYNKNDKDEVKLASYWGLYRWTIILLALASPFLIIGGGYLLYIMT